MSDSLFETPTDDVQIDPAKDYLSELVGDGKKFKTPEDLAKGKFMSDHYINTLTRKMDQMREDYTRLDADYKARAKLEEYIQTLTNNPPKPSSSESTPNANDGKPAFELSQIEKLLDDKLRASKAQEREELNLSQVKEKIRERFGSNYNDSLKERLDSLELTPEDVFSLAKRSPNAAIKALGLDEQRRENFQSPPTSQRRSDTFAPQGNQKRTWSYYQDLRKKNPSLYNDPKITKQMEKDYLELGDAFEDGDFHR